ncbi:hypothetical protein AAG906_003478 [Vitis piasezkii]
MQENESLREFMKRFGQVMLQIESYSMDVVLQIFKRSIYRVRRTMVDLFKRANKYSMLENDVYAATQQVLVTSRPARNDSDGDSKLANQLRQASKPNPLQHLIRQTPPHDVFQMARTN